MTCVTSVPAYVSVPGVLFPLTLFIIHYHPEPVEDCPCFEDSIAMLSVMLGVFVGHWWAFKQGYLYEGIVTRSIFDQPFWVAVLIVVYRMVFGELIAVLKGITADTQGSELLLCGVL